jgi:hypothetical protein
MTAQDPMNMPDGKDLLRGMGWVSLPFSCLGLTRRTGETKGNSIWSWIILVPWSSDGKPWIDGTEIVPATTKTHEQERDQIVTNMRTLLDDRYGETVAHRAVDDFIADVLDEK